MAGFDDPGAGMMAGTNDLQQSIDALTTATKGLTVAEQGKSMPGGMRQSPAYASAAEGQTFSSGTFPKMSYGTFGGGQGSQPAWSRTADRLDSMSGASADVDSGQPAQPQQTLGTMASGGGANAGGATFGGSASSSAPPSGGSGGGSAGGGTPPPPMGPTASGGGANAGGASFGGSGGGGASAGGSISLPGGGAAQNMLLYNAVGAQYQNQYGIPAQYAQNATFGSGKYQSWLSGQSPSDMAQGMATLNQMSSGNWGSSQFTQGLATANMATGAVQGMSGAQAAQFSSSVYNPMTSLGMMKLGLPTPDQIGTGNARSMSSWSPQLMQRLGMQQTGPNGTFNKQQMNALANPMSAQNLDLQNAGWSQSMIQNYASIEGTVNNATGSKYAQQHGITSAQVSRDLQTSQGGKGTTKSSQDQAYSQLQDMGVDRSTIQRLSNLNRQSTANQQATSGGYNSTLQQGISLLSDMNSALGKLYTDVHGIASAVGAAHGAGAVAGLGKSMLGGLGGGVGIGLGMKGIGSLLGGSSGGIGSLLGDSGAASLLGGSAAGGGVAGAATAAAPLAGGAVMDLLGQVIGSKTGSAAGKAAGTGGHKSGLLSSILGNVMNAAGPVLGGSSTTSFLTHMLGLATGGRVGSGFRPGTDSVPLMASEGEFVLNPNAAREAGYDNLQAFNDAHPVPGASTRTKAGILHAASGGQILSDAEKYKGHKYVFGGPSNTSGGWDCSSFASYVLGHDLGMSLPGGSWQKTTDGGKSHGDVASDFLKMPGAHKVGNNPKDIQAGDLLVWPSHVGFGVGPGTMFSAYGAGYGTLQTPKNMTNAGGPSGEQLTIMRIGAGGGNADGSGGSPGSSGPVGASSLSSGAGSGDAGNGGDSTLGLTANADDSLFGGGTGGNAQRQTPDASQTSSSSGSGNAGGSSGGATTKGKLSASQIEKLWTSLGGPASAAANMAKIAMAESGDDPSIKQANQPAATTGWGLYQITPTSGIKQDGQFGNLLNATNNTKAAIDLYKKSGYAPWASDAVGAGLSGHAQGGTFIAGERGPEAVTIRNGASADVMGAGETSALLSGTHAKAVQAPHSTGAAQQLLLDPSPANNTGSGSGGINISFGDFNFGGSSSQFSGTLNGGSDIMTMKQQFQDAVERAFQQSNLMAAIRSGDTGS